MKHILLIEDDIAFSKMLKHFLERHHYIVDVSFNIQNAFKQLKNQKFDLIFTDLRLPDGNGIEVLKEVKSNNTDIPVVLLTSYAEVSTAVQAMKQGAFDYISKPLNPDEVLEVISNALEIKEPTKNTKTEVKNEPKKTNTQFVEGISKVSKTLKDHIHLVAPTNLSVLVNGDSGTGKEVVAKNIHLKSLRSEKPFIAVDCGSIPKEIASSEFFGHKKGSFTGAINDKVGHFEAANGGTLFLDEVGNLSYENQIQLLRALQERKVKPVGSSTEILVDIRLITATNEDLLKAVEKGDFREDLYHRLNEFSIKVKEVLNFFQSYHWPGNLRELSNFIKRATLLSQTDVIDKSVLPEELINSQKNHKPQSFSTKENERELIISALENVKNNKTQAAKLLNITRKTLYNKMKEYEIN